MKWRSPGSRTLKSTRHVFGVLLVSEHAGRHPNRQRIGLGEPRLELSPEILGRLGHQWTRQAGNDLGSSNHHEKQSANSSKTDRVQGRAQESGLPDREKWLDNSTEIQ